MKQTSRIILIISIVVLVILGSVFYWFQIRPTQIRKECALNAKDPDLSSDYAKYVEGKNFFDQKVYDRCLLEHGLGK